MSRFILCSSSCIVCYGEYLRLCFVPSLIFDFEIGSSLVVFLVYESIQCHIKICYFLEGLNIKNHSKL